MYTWHPPLLGSFEYNKILLSGASKVDVLREQMDGRPDTVFLRIAKPDKTDERWTASPFVRVDGELKVGLLFRLPGIRQDFSDGLTGEYHRFAAEIEPVGEGEVSAACIEHLLPKPDKAADVDEPSRINDDTVHLPLTVQSQQASEQVVPTQATQEITSRYETPQSLRTKAELALYEGNLVLAAEKFKQLSELDDEQVYNDVAKMKHGMTLRRMSQEQHGVREQSNDMTLIDQAIDLLKKATAHRDIRYEAKARYELSKALFQRFRYNGLKEEEILNQAQLEALTAAKLLFDPAYISWYEKVVKADA